MSNMSKKQKKNQVNYFNAVYGGSNNNSANSTYYWQGKRGRKEASMEIKAEWPLIQEMSK